MKDKNVKKEEKIKKEKEIVKEDKKKENKIPKEKFRKVAENKVDKKAENKTENKKIEKERVKTKKEKKSKKWLAILILLIILIILALMVLYTSITPRSSINNLFTNLKNGNKFMASLNIDYDELISVLDSTIILNNNGNSMTDLEKKCFNELSWEITGESVENTNATVTASITTKNFRQVLLNWIEKISEVLENQEDIETEQNLQLLEESLVQDNVDTKTTEVTINLERKGLTWKVVIDDNFIDAIYPGLNQVLDVMKQLSNEVQENSAEQQ